MATHEHEAPSARRAMKGDRAHPPGERGHRMKMGWGRFAAMIATSTVIMFVLMHQLVYEADHLTFSWNRLIASVAMGGVMSVVMLGFMWSMYEGTGTKLAVLLGSSALALGLLAVNRQQSLIDDVRFMESMIPHHSIAINNARKADLRDPRVRELADQIIASQVKEIAEMQALLDDIERHGRRGDARLPARPASLSPEAAQEVRASVR